MTAAHKRWALYAAAAALAWAAWWLAPVDDANTTVMPAARSARAVAPAAAPPAGSDLAKDLAKDLANTRPRESQALSADPFGTNRTSAPTAVARAVPVPVLRLGAPALPFAYLGRWEEKGQTVIFLQRDGKSLTVRGAGPLDADYEVLAVEARQLRLKHMPTGSTALLSFDAPQAAASHLQAQADNPTAAADGEPQPGN